MRRIRAGWIAAGFFLTIAGRAIGQGPTIDTTSPGTAGSGNPTLASPGGAAGPIINTPGSGANPALSLGGQGVPYLGGRPGSTAPHTPTSVATPAGYTGVQPAAAVARLPILQNIELPNYGSFALTPGPEDIGPTNGMTLDTAIERMIRENLDLLSKWYEIPQAQADVLTASLRANPVFYADGQLVPYGQYSRTRAGGPEQFDVNVSYPVDWAQKRLARIDSATQARRVLEESMKDAVRMQLDNLYNAWVNVLAARQAVAYTSVALEGLRRVRETTASKVRAGSLEPNELGRVDVQLYTAEIGQLDAQETLRKAKIGLGTMLRMLPSEAEALEVRGSLLDRAPAPPSTDDLVRIALENRPDLSAYRVGIIRAQADVTLARRNRYQDIYVLWQPYTFQNNQPYGLKSATSWALGVTVPLPVYNRNQGQIRRAVLNVDQTRIEMQSLERQIIQDVRSAELEYRFTRDYVQRIEKEQRPAAVAVRSAMQRKYDLGQIDPITYLNALKEYNDFVKQMLDFQVRHRNAMLDLNTAVGRRVLP